MKILIAGANGLLGASIVPLLAERFDLWVHDVDSWDITCSPAGEELICRYRPDVVLNLAAMTDVDGCEGASELAEKVNAQGASIVADLCGKAGTKLIHVSTDYVFDGKKGLPYREDDEPNPASVYGRTKLEGERMVFEKLPSAVVIRTQWLYGKTGASFVDKIIRAAGEQGSVRVVNDQTGSPTYAKDLAVPIMAVIEKGLTGIVHVSNSGSCTWYEFARAIFSLKGMDVEVSPITTRELGRAAPRPPYSVFDLSRLEHDTGVRMRHWMEALKEYLA